MKLNATVWVEKSDISYKLIPSRNNLHILKGAYKGIEMYMLWLI